MFQQRRFWIGAGASLLFLALFFRQTDFAAMGQALREANYLLMVPAVAVYFGAVWFRALRWQYLLVPLGRLPLKKLYSIVVIGYMANDLLPLRAGELVRAYILGQRERMSQASILGTIGLERVFDGITLLLFMAVVSLFVPLADWLRDLARLMAAIFVGGLLALFLLAASEARVQSVLALMLRPLPPTLAQRLAELLSHFIGGLKVLHRPGWLLAILGTSALAWLGEAAMYYLVALAFALQQPFPVFLLVTAAANLAITLPSSQGGIGPFEWAAKTTLVLFGTEGTAATAYAIALHAALLVPVILLGLYYLWLENLSLGEVVRQRREPLPLSQEGED